MDTNNNTTPIVINAFPTPKEQIVNYALGLALTGATLIVGFGSLWVAGKVLDASANRAAKNATKKNTLIVNEEQK